MQARSTWEVVSVRLAEEQRRMRPLPDRIPAIDRRFVVRVPAQPYPRFDRHDYSLDPRLVGRRVEVRADQAELAAVALDTGELPAATAASTPAGSLRRSRQQQALEQLRGERKRRRSEPEVEIRPLARYDSLSPA
jgi:hypothetical protein